MRFLNLLPYLLDYLRDVRIGYHHQEATRHFIRNDRGLEAKSIAKLERLVTRHPLHSYMLLAAVEASDILPTPERVQDFAYRTLRPVYYWYSRNTDKAGLDRLVSQGYLKLETQSLFPRALGGVISTYVLTPQGKALHTKLAARYAKLPSPKTVIRAAA